MLKHRFSFQRIWFRNKKIVFCNDSFCSYNTKKVSCHFYCFLTGALSEAESSKNHVSNKAVVVILLLCVIITTLAFLCSIACYFYRRDKSAIQPPVFSSDRETSFNSDANLISHRSYSLPETKITVNSPIKHITG